MRPAIYFQMAHQQSICIHIYGKMEQIWQNLNSCEIPVADVLMIIVLAC